MTIQQLTPGFQGHIRIEDSQHRGLYQKDCATTQEVKDFVNANGGSKIGYGLTEMLVMPLRTDNLKDFATDLFLPTFFHFALKVENVVLRALASIVAIVVDVATVLIRLVATPIRFYYNTQYPEPVHPLVSLLGQNPTSKQALEEGTVILICKMRQTNLSPTRNEQGHQVQEAQKTLITMTSYIALRKLPGGVKEEISAEKESSKLLVVDGLITTDTYHKESLSQAQLGF